jgi:hypothetical protein
MIIQSISHKKGIVCVLVFAFILLINAEFTTGRGSYSTGNRGGTAVHTARIGVLAPSIQQKRFEERLTEGKRLMQEEFDYEGAIQKFNEALPHAVTALQKSDVYFFLSLAYYATLYENREQIFENTVRKLIQVDYYRVLDPELCPSKYIERFEEIKNEYGALKVFSTPEGADVYLSGQTESVGKTPLIVGVKAGEALITLKHGSKTMEGTVTVAAGTEIHSPVFSFPSVATVADKPVEEPPDVAVQKPEVAVQEGEKKKGGGKSMLFILGGIVVAGGAAAALLLGGGGEEDSVSTGSIQVNSNPTGADVHLDGQNTGRTTNTTLTNVSPGSHRIEVLKNGYGDYETNVSVTTGQTATVNATLAAHTIEVTQPTESTSWTPGEEVTIRWTTGGGSSQMGFMNAPGGMGATALIRRMSRMISARSNATARDSRERNTRRGDSADGKGSDSFSQGISAANETSADAGGGSGQSTLNTPRNSSLSRISLLGSSQTTSSNNIVKPQSLNHVNIELYRGSTLEETIISDTENDGRYDWTVSSSIPDASNYKIRVSAAGDSNVRGESPKFMIARLGELRVTSTPTGATIWVDGESYGETNKTIEIPAGNHELKLTLDRCQDWEDDVVIEENQRTTVEATLKLDSFEEDFNDGKADYYNNYSEHATWGVENNRYECKAPQSGYGKALYDLGKFENNWTYEAKAKRIAGNPYYNITLVFAAKDDFSVSYWFTVYPGTQDWRIARVTTTDIEENYDIILWKHFTDTVALSDWHTLKIVANGKNFSFYINDVLEASQNINGIPSSGKIGLATYIYEGRIIVVDDIKFTVR